ncbi:MAG: galactose mutarotase [Prevotellaceae bacterium]|jgi:aldose 1-epimerase|nr:galactose mutarotase [Prevotellaceae bacterium]
MSITQEPIGQYEGQNVALYTLRNSTGANVKIATYGGTITELWMPDKQGTLGNVVLGFDSLSGYRSKEFLALGPYFGATIGRYGNRIGGAKFSLDGLDYTLAQNNGANSLHGGLAGFDKVVWEAKELQEKDIVGLTLTYLSKDGEEGFPGNLRVAVTFRLTNSNELRIAYEATTDKPTHCNLTNHTYFNLAAGKAATAMDHVLTVNADSFTAVDAGLIPVGSAVSVEGTPFDFRTPHAIGERINDYNEQLKLGGGYDHSYVLNADSGKLTLAATAYDSVSGRAMEVYTTEPGVQLYAGNFLNGSVTGVGGITYVKRYGFCLETQHFPNTPNRPDFPSTVLRPGDTYASETVYKFLTK